MTTQATQANTTHTHATKQLTPTLNTMATVTINAVEFYGMVSMLNQMSATLAKIGAQAGMDISGISAPVQPSIVAPVKKEKKQRKKSDKPRAPSAHCLFLKAKAKELGINYKQAMMNADVIAEYKAGSPLVEQCKAEAKKAKEEINGVSATEAKPTQKKMGKRDALKKELTEQILAICGDKRTDSFCDEHDLMPLDMMGVSDLRAELKMWQNAKEEKEATEATVEKQEEALVEVTVEESEEILSADELDEMITFE